MISAATVKETPLFLRSHLSFSLFQVIIIYHK
jgi:hypothetical protein